VKERTVDPTDNHGSTDQPTLFDDDALYGDSAPVDGAGYRGPTACAAAGISYRQLDYWARTGLVEPSVRTAAGSGSSRLYSFRDIAVLRVVKKLLDSGISLQNIRAAAATLRARGVRDLAATTLMSDGTTIYELTSPDEIIDVLQRGQAVFGLALGRVVREVQGSLSDLPGERLAAEQPSATGADAADGAPPNPLDELARRRRARKTG
jgi:DNA-binding transcriptional MerR regulator